MLKHFSLSLVNPCDSSPCKNGATCQSVNDAFSCECVEGFEGDTCEEKGTIKKIFSEIQKHDCNRITKIFISLFIFIVNPCDSSPCKNGATCQRVNGKFSCKCAEGFKGNTCEEIAQKGMI